MNTTLDSILHHNSVQRWRNAEASKSGVLGGFDYTNTPDIRDTIEILQYLRTQGIGAELAIDCAAGIGRVSMEALIYFFDKIDLLEREQNFIEYCYENLAKHSQIGNIYHNSLQNFQFQNFYDLIWVQWGIQELSKDDSINFLARCKNNLTKNGVIIIKDNVMFDEDFINIKDGTIVRTQQHYFDMFKQAGLEVIKYGYVKDWFPQLLHVGHFILR